MLCDAEMFPFSSYPMYNRASRLPTELGKLVGVVRDDAGEREVPIERSAQFFPFSERTLRNTMNRILREDGRETAARALRDQLATYNARRAEHGGCALDGMRFYSMVFDAPSGEPLSAHKGALLVEARRQ
jgi:hypothetical protein